jgi:hypothetical protein
MSNILWKPGDWKEAKKFPRIEEERTTNHIGKASKRFL